MAPQLVLAATTEALAVAGDGGAGLAGVGLPNTRSAIGISSSACSSWWGGVGRATRILGFSLPHLEVRWWDRWGRRPFTAFGGAVPHPAPPRNPPVGHPKNRAVTGRPHLPHGAPPVLGWSDIIGHQKGRRDHVEPWPTLTRHRDFLRDVTAGVLFHPAALNHGVSDGAGVETLADLRRPNLGEHIKLPTVLR